MTPVLFNAIENVGVFDSNAPQIFRVVTGKSVLVTAGPIGGWFIFGYVLDSGLNQCVLTHWPIAEIQAEEDPVEFPNAFKVQLVAEADSSGLMFNLPWGIILPSGQRRIVGRSAEWLTTSAFQISARETLVHLENMPGQLPNPQ